MIVKGAVAIFNFLLEKNLRNTRFNAGSQRVLSSDGLGGDWAVCKRSAPGREDYMSKGTGSLPQSSIWARQESHHADSCGN